ncbi:MAG: hypothetical protein JRG96_11940 [Deltaproteobacteria bacterium]|nr:hypothetical protein [Deltaproteobacteria bacterium]MBW2418192.1 hypothetical protein [Deltaproteobacteria bacterium]
MSASGQAPLRHRILLSAASLALTLLLLELGLRLFAPVPRFSEDNMYFAPDPHTGYRLAPNGRGTFHNGIPANANRLGHRDDDPKQPKPEDELRILVVGDSFTVGRNVRRAEAYPQRLEARLRAAEREPVDVLNAGVGGWNPFQYAQYLDHYGAALESDLVIVGFFVGNDTLVRDANPDALMTAVLGRRVPRHSGAASPLLSVRVFLYKHSQLARLLMNRAPVEFDFARDDCRDFSQRFISIQTQRAVANHRAAADLAGGDLRRSLRQLSRMAAATRRLEIPLLVVLIPDESQINPHLQQRLRAELPDLHFDFDQPQPLIGHWLSDRGIPFLDLLPAFRRDSRCLYMNDAHWTPEGHEFAARRIAEHLASTGWLQ